MKITLIQPQYLWGKHIYLPNGIVSTAARLMAVGHDVNILDENIAPISINDIDETDVVGIGIVGATYAPSALHLAQKIRDHGFRGSIIFGGEFVNRLTNEEAQVLFSKIDNVCFSFDESLPTAEATSMTPAIEAMSENMQRAYFTREFCFYTSQGCAFNCNFCAAEKGTRERFRTQSAWEDETVCIAKMVRRFAQPMPEFSIYLSTLDCCQTPMEMERMLETASRNFAQEGITLNVRALATAKCTAKIAKHDPEILRRWHNYGLTCLAIGVDGNDPAVWKRENKQHNTASNVREAFNAIQAAGMLAEALMVVGFPGDSTRALALGTLACVKFTREGIRARPYLGKAHAPGSKGWKEDRTTVERLLANPEMLGELDYGSCGSPLTHNNRRQR